VEDFAMGLLWTLIIGLVVGALAKLLMPGKDPGGWLVTMLLGIAGSFVGTYLGRAIGHYGEDQGAGFIASTIGAVILLALYRLFTRRRATI
jgi:uncharacterized membrane protein YeaQ/YmgE (transglycosylase-associated protein family)